MDRVQGEATAREVAVWLEDVPLKEMTRRMRMMVEFAAINTEIALEPWRFSTKTMVALRERGAQLDDATIQTVDQTASCRS